MRYISHHFCWDVKVLNENSENGKNNYEVKNGYFSLYYSKFNAYVSSMSSAVSAKRLVSLQIYCFQAKSDNASLDLKSRKTDA